MITPPNHTDEDPDIAQLHPEGPGLELKFADEVDIDPSPVPDGHDEAGGVPQNPHNFHDHLAGPAPYAAHAERDHAGEETRDEVGVVGRKSKRPPSQYSCG
jgi:hypothetical protein